MPDEAPKPAGVSRPTRAYFMSDLRERVLRMDFLCLSYCGGLAYKHGVDPEGGPILIQHEGEFIGTSPTSAAVGIVGQTDPREAQFVDRYARRRRTAAYENQYKPVVDKFCAYLTQSAPRRTPEVVGEASRLKLDVFVREMLCDGLKMGEAWVGWDTADLGDLPITVREAKQADPANAGQPYLVSRDPRAVVDFDQGSDGRVTRVVFEEVVTTKPSLVSPPTSVTEYREWTDTEWVLYRAVRLEKDPNTGVESYQPYLVSNTAMGVDVEEVDRKAHAFGRCPWTRFVPRFPSEDLAELNRALFNATSLLDEETYKNTFTQKYAIGCSTADLYSATTGPGNWLAFPNPETDVGTFGSVAGQADTLMAMMEMRREAIFSIVSMDHSKSVKNAAESAEKRKLDLENLYATLVKIAEEAERCENELLVGLGLADAEVPDSLSRYDRKFDVHTLQDLLADLKTLSTLPFVPAEFKRAMVAAVIAKMDPFSDAEEYDDGIEGTIDATPATAQALVDLKNAGLLTAKLAAAVLGVPEADMDEFGSAADGHDQAEQDLALAEAEAAAANGFGGPGTIPGDAMGDMNGGPTDVPKPDAAEAA